MPLTPDEIEAERGRFEAWWYDRYGSRRLPIEVFVHKKTAGGYWNDDMQKQWESWIAAIESERERVRQRQDDAEALTEKLGRFWPSGERAE